MTSKTHILVVDDEPNIREVVELYLRREGYDVEVTADGAAALVALERKLPDLVVLDLMLPEIDGLQIARILRQGDTDIPIIMLTAKGDESDRITGLELGADDYVTKPFSPRELTARVKAVLRRVQQPQPPAPPRGQKDKSFPFEVDEKRQAIYYYGTQVQTSRYEYRLMKILIDHPGWVYTREQLMELAWEDPDMSLVRTVDAHIKNLRHKLKDITPDCDPIITHRGTGYALKEDW